ncbi:unnamed protein product [Heligmosomoides polygyrus]|uniref:TetR_C_8 domain-containing protein n=1 Tax=Heligmosomoides polygyrus TaxID=6339 RepID=A0A183FD96_HELPZ|nr:unnamed protein product [Heligmosomoides polygyrus]
MSATVPGDSVDVPNTSATVHDDHRRKAFTAGETSDIDRYRRFFADFAQAARNFSAGLIEVDEHESEVDQSISINVIGFLWVSFKLHGTSVPGLIEVLTGGFLPDLTDQGGEGVGDTPVVFSQI